MSKRLFLSVVVSLSVLFAGLPLGMAAAQTPEPTTAANNGSVTVETIPGQSLKQIVTTRAERSWPWYVVRASGIVAGISLVALLLSGIGSITGHYFRLLDPLTAWATHRALGITFVLSVIIHMVTLLFDKFVPFSFIDIVVPWASHYRTFTFGGIPLGSIFVALGVLAFYGSLIVVITSLLLVDKKPRLWKLIHYLSYLIMAEVFIHALVLGTDTGHGIGRVLWLSGGGIVLIAIGLRLRRAGSA